VHRETKHPQQKRVKLVSFGEPFGEMHELEILPRLPAVKKDVQLNFSRISKNQYFDIFLV